MVDIKLKYRINPSITSSHSRQYRSLEGLLVRDTALLLLYSTADSQQFHVMKSSLVHSKAHGYMQLNMHSVSAYKYVSFDRFYAYLMLRLEDRKSMSDLIQYPQERLSTLLDLKDDMCLCCVHNV